MEPEDSQDLTTTSSKHAWQSHDSCPPKRKESNALIAYARSISLRVHSYRNVRSPLEIALRILIANRNAQIIRSPVVATGMAIPNSHFVCRTMLFLGYFETIYKDWYSCSDS